MLDEYAAFSAALGVGSLSGKVFDTVRLDSTGQLVRAAYVVLYGGAPDALTDDRYTSAQRTGQAAIYVYTVRCVAPDPSGVRAVMSAAFANITGNRLTITGRTCSPIAFETGGEVQRDDSVPDSLYFSDLEFRFISSPA